MTVSDGGIVRCGARRSCAAGAGGGQVARPAARRLRLRSRFQPWLALLALLVACDGGGTGKLPAGASGAPGNSADAARARLEETAAIRVDPTESAALRSEIDQLRVDKQLLQDRIAQLSGELETLRKTVDTRTREAQAAHEVAEAEATLRSQQEAERADAARVAAELSGLAAAQAREAELARQALERQQTEQALAEESARRVIEGQFAQQQLDRAQAQAAIDAQAARFALQAEAQRADLARQEALLQAQDGVYPALVPVPRRTGAAAAKSANRRDWRMLPPPPENIPLIPR